MCALSVQLWDKRNEKRTVAPRVMVTRWSVGGSLLMTLRVKRGSDDGTKDGVIRGNGRGRGL